MSLRKILFVGIPGSGKGTQANALVPYGFKNIGTGEIIREAWKRNDPLVIPYKAHIESGGFLPDREVFQLINRQIEKIGESDYVLDGAIRNLAQAEIAMQQGLIGQVLCFFLDEEEAVRRLAKRYEIEGRADDSPDVVVKRMLKYKKETEPVINYFLERMIPLHTINALPSISKVHQEVLKILKLK